MWTLENRPRYDRNKLRYPSDLTDQSRPSASRELGELTPPAGRPGAGR
jgi:hypothetical protein